MRKKYILLITATIATLALTLMGCGKEESEKDMVDQTSGKTSVQILEEIWDLYGEEEKFAINGGDYIEMVSDAPGAIDVSEAESMNQLFGFPEESADLIDDGASMMHMMNQNTFTAGVYHLVDEKKTEDIADLIKENILARQWICGCPDKVVVYSAGSFIISAFGNEELIDNFKEKLETAYSNAEMLHEENII